METHRRRQAILTLLEERGEVAVDELAADLDVSQNTIRNDLNALAGETLVRRVRGGAVAIDGASVHAKREFAARVNHQKSQKEQMGHWAAQLVQDGDAIVLDASSTIYHLAKHLLDRQNLTVVTNGLETAVLLARNPSNKIILAADTVRPDGFSIVGQLNLHLLHHFTASRCFLSCSGFTVEQGLMEVDIDEGPLKAQMSKLAGQVIALVDYSKFGKIDTYRFAALSQINHLVVDDRITARELQLLQQAATCHITVVGESTAETIPPGVIGVHERAFRIGFGGLSERIPFARQVRSSIERAASRHNSIELLVRDNDLDRQRAFENVDWFVANQVDLAIEYQIDAQAGNIIMDRFKQAHIPVIAVDIALPGATFFGVDNYRAGFMAGEALGAWISEHWLSQLDYLIKLEMSLVGQASSARLLGQQVGLESTLGFLASRQIITVDTPGIFEQTIPPVQDLLPTLPLDAKIAIVGLNDDVVLAALSVFEQANRLSQVVAVGQGADGPGRAALRRPGFPFIGSASYAPEKYGEQLLPLALKILCGEVVPPAVFIQHVFLTRDNVDETYPLAREDQIARADQLDARVAPPGGLSHRAG